MLRLRSDPYEWAITHLLKKKDTDLFPKPFELEAIENFPDDAIKSLQKTDVGSYSWHRGRNTIVPKSILSFRPATQLDPWDSLILTALLYEFGEKIEKKRIPYGKGIVFSYRFLPMKHEGEMYDRDADWPSFWGKSRERAASIGGYVAIADVSNYYNQISHDTLKAQLLDADVPQEAVESVIKLCSKVSQDGSRGIPVGPHATHLLAECAFDPIDRCLMAEGYTFCRFVDDIHIFCKTWEEAQIAFYDLADILDKQQKLSLQSQKSKILSADEFIEFANNVISETPHTDLETDVIEVIDRYSKGDRYRNIDYGDLTQDDLNILSQQNLETLLNSYLAHPNPNFVRIRWFFRRLAQVGVPGAVPLAVSKLEQFSPAIADLAAYLLSAKNNYTGIWKDLGDQVLHALELPIIRHSEYLNVILLDLFTSLPTLNHVESILQKYKTSSPMVRREIIRVATTHNAHYWLRQRKEELLSADTWLRRALIEGASTFTKDERISWLQHIEEEGTELEKLIAKKARTEPLQHQSPLNIPGSPTPAEQIIRKEQSLTFPQITAIMNPTLRANIERALPDITEERVDIGLFLLGREFETTLKEFLVVAYTKGKLKSTPGNKNPNELKLADLISCVKSNGIVTEEAALSYLRQIRNDRAHGGTPSLEERRLLMRNVQYLASLYIDYLKFFDDLTREL